MMFVELVVFSLISANWVEERGWKAGPSRYLVRLRQPGK
jgi:hypothetical protein